MVHFFLTVLYVCVRVSMSMSSTQREEKDPVENLLMGIATQAIQGFRIPGNKDPIDEDDVAFMYMVGLLTGMKTSKPGEMVKNPELRALALAMIHGYKQQGYSDRCRELRGLRPLAPDQFRLCLE